jgi:protein-S-isoprenylcysteine O-methyltransferase Ste14
MIMDTNLFLRIVLLATSAFSVQVSCTTPTGVPRNDEQAKYKNRKFRFAEDGFSMLHAVSATKASHRLALRQTTLTLDNCRLQAIVHAVNTLDLVILIASAVEAYNLFNLPPKLAEYAHAAYGGGHQVSPAILVGIILMAVGTLGRMITYRYLGNLYTFHLSIKKDHKLITTGPYAIVRHPAYAVSYFFVAGVAIAVLGPGSIYDELGLWDNPLGWATGMFLLVCLAYTAIGGVLRTRREDEALRSEFGKEWDAWAARTPYRLIPFVF